MHPSPALFDTAPHPKKGVLEFGGGGLEIDLAPHMCSLQMATTGPERLLLDCLPDAAMIGSRKERHGGRSWNLSLSCTSSSKMTGVCSLQKKS